MNKVIIGLLLVAATTSFAGDFCFTKDGESTFTGVAHGDLSSEFNEVTTIESYNGEEIGSLKKGKKTYIIRALSSNLITSRLRPGPIYTKHLENLGFTVEDHPSSFRKNFYNIVTQDEEVKKMIFDNRNKAFCTHGTQLLGFYHFDLGIKERRQNALLERKYIELYQVVEKVEKLSCKDTFNYTPEALEEYAVEFGKNYDPVFLKGEQVAATCYDFFFNY